jgi:DNA-binding HxlR family transcriptional regulator
MGFDMKTSNELCPIYRAIELVGQKWNLHIIRALFHGYKRFNALSRHLGINPRTLHVRLKQLEKHGIIQRKVIKQMPLNVEYCLTPRGKSLNEIFEALAQWGHGWTQS